MTDLDSRYGRAPGNRRIPRWLAWTLFGVFLAVVIAFWGVSQLNASATIESEVAGFSQSAPHEVTVTARVSVQPGTALACAVQAQSETDSVVGYRVVVLPASDEHHRTLSVTLRTTGPVDTAVIRECWVPESTAASENAAANSATANTAKAHGSIKF